MTAWGPSAKPPKPRLPSRHFYTSAEGNHWPRIPL